MEGLCHKLQEWSNAVKDGQLSFDEVVQMLHPMLEQEVRVLFDEMDEDRRGVVSSDEFARYFFGTDDETNHGADEVTVRAGQQH